MIVRIYTLKEGDIFKRHGIVYRVFNIHNRKIMANKYRGDQDIINHSYWKGSKERLKKINVDSHSRITIGANSQERVELIYDSVTP